MINTWVDGNSIAGMLGELFIVDVTTARGACAQCGHSQQMAETRVYQWAPGAVARCVTCDAILLRMVRAADRAWLDLSGLKCLEIAMPPVELR
jgi:Family of unknown function (DUF6510)